MTLRDVRFLTKPEYSNSRGLVVGIDRYQHASPLQHAVSDASAMHRVLVDNLGFDVTLLTDADATREGIRRAYMEFAERGTAIDDRVIVYFAGHGETRLGNRREIGFLVPVDGDPEDLSTLIAWEELTRTAKELIIAKHVFFIIDACYGGLALTRTTGSGGMRFVLDLLRRHSRQVLTAGKADQPVADGSGPLAGHSLFTGHLLQGITGDEAKRDGLLTASLLMAYVYDKVGRDPESRQTPHYGHIDGDGDLILVFPNNHESDDTQFHAPFFPEHASPTRLEDKISRAKSFLSSDASVIELHDFAVGEMNRFLDASGEDYFPETLGLSQDEQTERIVKYNEIVGDLSLILACISSWARPEHHVILQKVFLRTGDRLAQTDTSAGVSALRWYPLVVLLYCAGIAAVEGRRYDALASILYARCPGDGRAGGATYLVEVLAKSVKDLTTGVFRSLPEYCFEYVPVSEYLYKTRQPQLDDLLLTGRGYEEAFDRFEMLFALAAMDCCLQNNRAQPVVPAGRFAWKQRNCANPPLTSLQAEAQASGEDWEPLRRGLFGGDLCRFNAALKTCLEYVRSLNW